MAVKSENMRGRISLGDRHSIPQLGFGTCGAATCTSSALSALEQGYIHLDTAQIYGNETEVGQAIKKSGISPHDLFVCSKLWEDMYGRQHAIEGVEASRQKLGVDVIDLYLLHTPRPGPQARLESWLGLQDCVEKGRVKSIGVSNWAPKHFEQLKSSPGVTIQPVVNQIEFHPWQQQREIRKFCSENGITVVAYSPLTQGRRLGDETIVRFAKRYKKTPAQVVLRWCLQHDVVVIPKSDNVARIQENTGIFDWSLSDDDMAVIDALDEGQKGNLGEWDPFAWE